MRLLGQLYLVLSLALSFSAVSAAHLGGAHARKHTDKFEVSARPHGEINVFKRQTFSNARFTYFADGLGACGTTNSPSDFIVALNSEQYGSGGYCFQTITISYNGKTTQAQITDECPGCPYGGLDMSTGLFDFFADPSAGVIYGDWWFGGGSGGGAPSSSSTPPPPPSSTWSPPPSPTSTWSPPPPPPTTSAAPSTTSTTSSATPTSTSSSASSSSVASSSTSSNLAVSTSIPLPTGINTGNSNILALNQAIIQLGSFLISADQSQ